MTLAKGKDGHRHRDGHIIGASIGFTANQERGNVEREFVVIENSKEETKGKNNNLCNLYPLQHRSSFKGRVS